MTKTVHSTAQLSQSLALFADCKGDQLVTVTQGRARFTVRAKNAGAVAKRLATASRRNRTPGARMAEHRDYPEFKPGMSTAQYVRLYNTMASHAHGIKGHIYDQLNEAPATLYEGRALDFVPLCEVVQENAAAEQVREVVAQAAAAVAIEAAQATSAPEQAQDVRELETVCEGTAQAQEGAGSIGRASSTHLAHAGPVDGQRVAGKSGAWRAVLHMASGRPALWFSGPRGVESASFDTGRERMAALQRLAQAADALAQPQPTEAPETCTDEAPRDLQRARPVAIDPRALLQAGVPIEKLVGLGVVYSGDMANVAGCGAITAAAPDKGNGLRLTVTLEDGREWQAHPISFDDRPGSRLRFDHRFHGAPYLAQLAAARAMRTASTTAAKQQAAETHARQLQELAAQYPQLQRPGPTLDSLRCASNNIRALLRAAFPGVKFSVKVSRFSGGDSISIAWTDGPTTKQVDAIADRFEAGSFDGMTDSYTYRRSAWTQLFGDAKYISSSRSLSDAAVAAIIAKEWGSSDDAPTVADYRAGRMGIDASRRFHVAGQDWTAQS